MSQRDREDLQRGDIAEVWACPECGTESLLGVGTGIPRFTTPPTCGMGHKPREMEQKIARPEHGELIDRALTNPDFRVDLS